MEAVFQFLNHIATDYGTTFAVLFLLIVLLLFGVYFIIKTFPNVIRGYVEHKLIENQVSHQKATNRRKSVAPEITKILSELLVDTNGDRALLLEFSNGSSNLAGLPFLFISATSEALIPGVSSVSHIYQRINISLFAKFILELEDKGYFYTEDIISFKEDYPFIYNFMHPNNVKSALFYSIYGVGQTLGFIVVTTTNEKTFARQDVLPRCAEAAQVISSLLNLDELDEKINNKYGK